MRSLAFILLFLFPFLLAAQDFHISGSICDSVSGEALAGANIIVRSSETGQLVSGTTSNVNGGFSIRAYKDQSYLVLVTFIGYKPVQFGLEPNQTRPGKMAIRLSPSPIMLNEVVVPWKPLLEYADDGSVAFNLDMLGDMEGLSAADALEMVPGFYLDFDDRPTYNGVGGFTTLINGETHRGIMIGAGLNGGTALYTLRSIPANCIKRVEIIPEPMGQYGYFTPIINLVTKGELMDLYNAQASARTNEKYGAGVNISKSMGKIWLKPSLDFSSSSVRTRTEEEVAFASDGAADYNRHTDWTEHQAQGQVSLDASYRNAKNRIELGLTGSPLYTVNKKNAQASFYPSSGQSLLNNERYRSKPEDWGSSVSISREFETGLKSSLRLQSELNYRHSLRNETQLDDGTNYRQKFKQNSTTATLNTTYSLRLSKLVTTVNMKYNYQNNYGFSERLKQEEEQWASQTNFFNDQRQERSATTLSIRANQRLRNPGTFIRLGFSGSLTNDKVRDYGTNDLSKDDYFRFSSSADYSDAWFKQRIGLGYRYQILWPTLAQLSSSPEYLNEHTMRIGNPGLNPGQEHILSFDLNSGYRPGVISTGGNTSQQKSFGYSFRIDHKLTFDGIENSQNYINDSILVITYANSSEKSRFNCSGNIFYHYRNRFRVQLGGQFGSEKFHDNAIGNRNGDSWSVFTKLKVGMLSGGKLELKYRYNSPQIAYRSKVFSSHDASLSFSRSFLKNKLMAQAELTNLLGKRGVRTEYVGDSFYSNKVVKDESPFISIRVNYILFSFYDRKALD